MSEMIPACVNCRYVSDAEFIPKCNHPKFKQVNPVYGEFFGKCKDVRGDSALCGYAGVGFLPMPKKTHRYTFRFARYLLRTVKLAMKRRANIKAKVTEKNE